MVPAVAAGVESGARVDTDPILRVRGATKTYLQNGRTIAALTDVSLEVRQGETLGLVGESGSGKTTLAKAILG